MLAAALLASLWAQAEQAPVAAPAAAPAPAPAAPVSAGVGGRPAPLRRPRVRRRRRPHPRPRPRSPTPEHPYPANSVSVHVRYAYRVDSGGDSLVPAAGLSLGGEFERRLLGFTSSGIELGAAFDFFYDRFAKDVIATTTEGTGIASRTLSHTSFALMQTTAWRYADLRFFAGIGAGFAVGYFGKPGRGRDRHHRPHADRPRRAGHGLRRHRRGPPPSCGSTTTAASIATRPTARAGITSPLFGDIFDAGIGLLVRF